MDLKFRLQTYFENEKQNKNFIFFLFLLFYTFFLIYISNKLIIWDDESCSLSTTANSLTKVINLSYHFEGQPPVYFIILSLWRKINEGIFFARLLSVIFTFLSAFVLYKIIRLIFEKLFSKWLIIIFLLNPYTVWASLEIRLYSFLILLSLTAIYLFYLIYFYNRPKLKFLFVLVGIMGVYTQYYFSFLIISLSILLLFIKGWRSFLNFCLWSMVIAVTLIPNLLFIGDQYAMHQNPLVKEIWYLQISNIFYSPLQFLFNTSALHLGNLGHWFALMIFVLLVLLLFYKLYKEFRNHKYQDIKTIYGLFIPVISLLIIFTIVFLVFNLFYLLHYLTIIFPFYCLLYSAFGIFNRKIRTIIYGIIVAYYIFLLAYIYHPPFIKRLDIKSFANYIHYIERKNEPILFREKSITLTFKPYYKGCNSLIPLLEKPFDYNFYRTEIKDTNELKLLIGNNIRNYESFLFVNWDDHYVNIKDLTNKKMDIYLEHNYRKTMDTIFSGKNEFDYLRVRRLYKK